MTLPSRLRPPSPAHPAATTIGALLLACVCLGGCDRRASRSTGAQTAEMGSGPSAPVGSEARTPASSSAALEAKMLRDRVVLLGTPIDDAAASRLIEQLRRLEAQDASAPILVYVNSPGGVVEAGLRILDTMLALEPTLQTVVIGKAEGVAACIAAAGDPGHRRALTQAAYQLLPSRGGLGDPAAAAHLDEQLVRRLAAHTGQSVDAVRAASEQERRWTAEQAVAWGLVDRVVDRRTP